VVISVLFSILGLTLGAGLIIDFVSVRDGLIIAPTLILTISLTLNLNLTLISIYLSNKHQYPQPNMSAN